MSKKIILIDANNIAYRAFYALPMNIATSSGIITNAVYGFAAMLIKLMEEYKPDNLVAAFDSKGPTFRHELFAKYKAQRKKMPDELVSQFPLIKQVLESLNITCIEKDGYEADDIIAALSLEFKNKFDEVIIFSGDKDILQLVDKNVKVISMKKGITETAIFNKKEVIEKFSVDPLKIKDLLALMGDSSDNIPGVAGIGPKTAVSLIKEFGAIEDIYENIDKIKNERLRNLLIDQKEDAFASKKLTELCFDIEINSEKILSKKISETDVENMGHVFDDLEFKTLKDRINKSDIFNIAKNRFSEKENEITEKKEIKKIFYRFPNTGSKETFPNSSSIIFIAVFNEKDSEDSDESGIIVKQINETPVIFTSAMLLNDNYMEAAKNIFENEKTIKCGIDLKKIYKMLKRNNIDLKGRFKDLKIIYLLLNSTRTNAESEDIIREYATGGYENCMDYELECGNSLAAGYTKNPSDSQKKSPEKEDRKFQMSLDMLGSSSNNKEKPPLNAGDLDEINNDINIKKTILEINLYDQALKKAETLLAKENLLDLYNNIEEPLIKVLAEMEYRGIALDKNYMQSLIIEFENDINKLTDEIYEICQEKFNINSPQQLAKILYEKLKLLPLRKTKTGLSTDARTLVSLIDKNPVIEKILDYREKMKLKNTYIDVLPNLMDKKDKRIHTNYNQLGTTTGRMSSNDPNLQNIPIRTDTGRKIRKAFIPGKGYDLLISADYSQIELRILAHMCEDEKLIEVFKKGEDIHTFTAAEIFNMNTEKVTEDLRRKAKAINFGIIYGMTEYGLKNRLSITEEEAKQYIKLYFERYPKVKDFISILISDAYKKGYTETLFGRKRQIYELGSSNARLRSLGERLAVNTPIQGSAADIMKIATIKLYENLQKSHIDCNILLQVHDELVLESKKEDLKEVSEIVRESMEECVKLKVELKVDIKCSENWYI